MNKNTITGVEYQNTNQDILEEARKTMGYESNEWCTFLQAKELGKQVRKGQHGVRLARVVPYTKREEGKLVDKKGVKYFTVFNIAQLEDVNKVA